MPKTLPVVFIDEALLPESRQFSSSVKGWQLKAVDRRLARTPGLEHRTGSDTCFKNTRGALHRTMSAAARLGLKWTFVEEDGSAPEPLKALPPIEPEKQEKLSVPEETETPKVTRSRKKHATMPARLGPIEEMTSARMEDIREAARGRLPSEPALPDISKTAAKPAPLTAAGEPDVPVVIRKKKKVVTMPELRKSPPTL
eukprot:symbB.v1.2.040692.t1/scaffold7445.1/size11222/2